MILCDVVEDTMLHKPACSLVFGRLTLAFSHMYVFCLANAEPREHLAMALGLKYCNTVARIQRNERLQLKFSQLPHTRKCEYCMTSRRDVKEGLENCTTARRPSYSSRACDHCKTFVFKSTRGCRTVLTYMCHMRICLRSPNK